MTAPEKRSQKTRNIEVLGPAFDIKKGAHLKKFVENELKPIGAKLVAAAKAIAPVDTGRFQRGITYKIKAGTGRTKSWVALRLSATAKRSKGKNAPFPYWVILDAKHGYLTNVMKAHADEIRSVLDAAMSRWIAHISTLALVGLPPHAGAILIPIPTPAPPPGVATAAVAPLAASAQEAVAANTQAVAAGVARMKDAAAGTARAAASRTGSGVIASLKRFGKVNLVLGAVSTLAFAYFRSATRLDAGAFGRAQASGENLLAALAGSMSLGAPQLDALGARLGAIVKVIDGAGKVLGRAVIAGVSRAGAIVFAFVRDAVMFQAERIRRSAAAEAKAAEITTPGRSAVDRGPAERGGDLAITFPGGRSFTGPQDVRGAATAIPEAGVADRIADIKDLAAGAARGAAAFAGVDQEQLAALAERTEQQAVAATASLDAAATAFVEGLSSLGVAAAAIPTPEIARKYSETVGTFYEQKAWDDVIRSGPAAVGSIEGSASQLIRTVTKSVGRFATGFSKKIPLSMEPAVNAAETLNDAIGMELAMLQRVVGHQGAAAKAFQIASLAVLGATAVIKAIEAFTEGAALLSIGNIPMAALKFVAAGFYVAAATLAGVVATRSGDARGEIERDRDRFSEEKRPVDVVVRVRGYTRADVLSDTVQEALARA